MFVQIISSEPPYILLPNQVWLCSIISQSVMQKKWFTVFNVKVTVRSYMIKIWLILLYLLNSWSVCNQIWFDSTASQAGVSCGKTWLLRSIPKSQQMFEMSVWPNVSVQYTKLGMVVYYHEAMCHTEKLVHYLQCQGHSKGLYNQNMTIFTMSSRLLVCLQPNLVW